MCGILFLLKAKFKGFKRLKEIATEVNHRVSTEESDVLPLGVP